MTDFTGTTWFSACASVVAPSNPSAPEMPTLICGGGGCQAVSGKPIQLPSCAQVNSFLGNTGHAGSVLTLGAAGYTAWTGVAVPYLVAAGIISAVADLTSLVLDHIPGCK